MSKIEDNERSEIKKVKKLYRAEKNARMKLRYNVIMLYLRNYHKREIAAIFDISYDAVNDYINSYNKEGIAGLAMGKSTGSPRKLTPSQEQQLFDTVTNQTPSDVGFSPFMNWTADLACQFVVREFFVKFTSRGMRAVFYRLNLTWTRPTYTLKKADPEKQEQFRIEFEDIKKN